MTLPTLIPTLASGAIGSGASATLLVPVLTAGASVLCGLFAIMRNKTKLPAFASVALIGSAFAAILYTFLNQGQGAPVIAHGFDWFNLAWGSEPGQTFVASFSFYIDSLTLLWMLFVTGLATLIALYASEYMSHDVGPGYCRFFAAFTLFVFSMSCLVMADNLVLLYLGWEGVGLCSYLLIGYFYKKPSAVAAAKKAFIVNRIGDLGLALGVWLTFVKFGTVEYSKIFEAIQPFIEHAKAGHFDLIPWEVKTIPLLLMIGAFGKSAQLPLYVWLPDAMEGPTPVSALIHAATMVTAGVYLVARMLPVFVCSEYALPIVAWVGALTALLSATIGMAQFDIKRIMAYSTVSQLGYMFAGLGVLSAAGSNAEMAAAGPYHVFTHAFFKALLFLSCGAVMHGFGGQLDLRKLSGVMWMPGWRIVGLGMLVGCINLAGVTFTAGFFSKDSILANAFASHGMAPVGWILLLTAGLTAYYTFRVFFRVFVGPQHFEAGDEAHGHDDHAHAAGHGHDAHADHGHAPAHAAAPAHADHAHDFHPHPPGWAINTVLGTLALASLVIGAAATFMHFGDWLTGMVEHGSTGIPYAAGHAAAGHEAAGHAAEGGAHAHATFFGFDPHQAMMVVSSVVGLVGIAVAFFLHFLGRTTAATSRADALLPVFGPIAVAAQHKWYVDEFYDATIRKPLRGLAHVFHLIDQMLVDGLVNLFGMTPRLTGSSLRPSQSGVMHAYAAGMAAGLALIFLVAMLMLR